MSFNANIKKWIAIDNDIKILNNDLKNKREIKNNILKDINIYKNDNNLSNTLIKFNNDKLKFINTKQYVPLTYNFIRECLEEIMEDTSQIDFLLNHLKEKRKYKIVEDIKRIYL